LVAQWNSFHSAGSIFEKRRAGRQFLSPFVNSCTLLPGSHEAECGG
jgi:hypothetical protein